MSYKHLLACGAIAMALVSCNKELENHKTPATPVEGNAYVALNINLPTNNGTRANSNFADGTVNEYKVQSIAVIFYDKDGNHVANYTTVPTPWLAQTPTTDAITTRVQNTYNIETTEESLQALVLINPLQNGYVQGDFEGSYATLKAKKFGTTVNDTDAFLMSNSPKYDGTSWKELVTISTATNEAEAVKAAKTVEVERTLAKVELELGSEFKNYEYTIPAAKANTGDVITAKAWNVDITNSESNLIRQVNNAWKDEPLVTAGRPYYSVDANYDAKSTLNKLTDAGITIQFDVNTPAYCHENTMNYNLQDISETTSVLIKAVYAPAEANIVKGSAETYAAGDWYMVGSGKMKYTLEGLKEAIVKALVNQGADEAASKTAVETVNYPTDGGTWAGATIKVGSTDYTTANLMGEIIYYKGGVCYYRVPIRHFTAEEQNYANEDAFKAAYTQNNGEYAEKDLGRYGVVRNNWYKLTLNTVSEPGSPVVPDVTDTNDDAYETYVSCNIDILAWSVRNHGIDL